MSRPSVALNAEVRLRAGGRCEYCQFPEIHAVIPFEVEHVIPIKHGGLTDSANLALACFYCNRYKGPNVAGLVDPGAVVTRLFHPRIDAWGDHFVWREASIVPLTDVAVPCRRGCPGPGGYEKALGVREELVKLDPANTEFRREVAVSHAKLGQLREAQGAEGRPAALAHYSTLQQGGGNLRRDEGGRGVGSGG